MPRGTSISEGNPPFAVDGRERPLWVRERSVWEARKGRPLALSEGDRA
jgi:hypothetical protein